MHGYDVVDPTQLNDELGSAHDFEYLIDQLNQAGLAVLLDVVPNHMSVASDQNQWWMDVLMHGPASRYAAFFDIDWRPHKSELENKVLLPVLAAPSGNVLESGKLAVRYSQGDFCLECNDYQLPLDPKTYVDLLSSNLEEVTDSLKLSIEDEHSFAELRSIIAALNHMPARDETSVERVDERYREVLVNRRRLQHLVSSSPAVAEHITNNLRKLNGTVGRPESFDQLDRLLESQAYRLVHWKASSDEINYRRFFDVTSLAALCVERLEVFRETHRLVMQWVTQGRVAALRIDHVDGLFDPTQYLWRLQWFYLRELGQHAFSSVADESVDRWPAIEQRYLQAMQKWLGGPDPASLLDAKPTSVDTPSSTDTSNPSRSTKWPLPVLVEKILSADEPLPQDWPVLGTTGYDFLNTLNGLFLWPEGLKRLINQYQRFVPEFDEFEETMVNCKRLILSGPMRSEVTLLATRLDRLAHRSRYYRDFTLNALEFALQEIIACFNVYRTYIRASEVSARDGRILQRAVAMAKRRNPATETEAIDFVRDVLLMREPRDLDEASCQERESLVGRFQQVTSPVQAKGIEDTAFYRYIPLLSMEEVGGEPRLACKSTADYHAQNIQRHELWPTSMLATTTHDTKRSEDVRARLNVLTEAVGPWRKALQRWVRLNRKYVREVEGFEAPCRNDQWMFYQTLVGVWPVSPPTTIERAELISRLQQFMEKATHEAKLRTSWISPNQAYDAAVKHFVAAVLSEDNKVFNHSLQEFIDSVLDFGLANAAAQVALKMTAPGVPDIYQGQEIWDFSLVDPDNRRPVDYQLRQHLLHEIEAATHDAVSRQQFARYLADNPRDNRFKFWVTLEGLSFKQRLTTLGPQSLTYVPLTVEGPLAEHVIAHAWYAGTACQGIVIVPRFLYSLGVLAHKADWSNTYVKLPPECSQARLNQFTHQLIDASAGHLELNQVFADFPIAFIT